MDEWMDAHAGDLPLTNLERELLMTAIGDRIDAAATNPAAAEDKDDLLVVLARLDLMAD